MGGDDTRQKESIRNEMKEMALEAACEGRDAYAMCHARGMRHAQHTGRLFVDSAKVDSHVWMGGRVKTTLTDQDQESVATLIQVSSGVPTEPLYTQIDVLALCILP